MYPDMTGMFPEFHRYLSDVTQWSQDMGLCTQEIVWMHARMCACLHALAQTSWSFSKGCEED